MSVIHVLLPQSIMVDDQTICTANSTSATMRTNNQVRRHQRRPSRVSDIKKVSVNDECYGWAKKGWSNWQETYVQHKAKIVGYLNSLHNITTNTVSTHTHHFRIEKRPSRLVARTANYTLSSRTAESFQASGSPVAGTH